ncbi:NAD(P)/FAD-dependent oxidoreductase [Nocardia panacis]|nr:NAD(P)/FAD-dependent oxidoreductase [Nocardia panacis]
MGSNATEVLWDAVLIGGGAAGLSAAVTLARAGRKVLVVDEDSSRAAATDRITGLFSREGISPAGLLRLGHDDAQRYGATCLDGRVTALNWRGEDQGFLVETATGEEVATRAVVVGTGLSDQLPDITGLRERWGREVLFCPYMDGYEVRGERIGLIGGPDADASVAYAQLLRQWTGDLIYFPRGAALTEEHRSALAARDIHLLEGEVANVVTVEDRLRGVELDDGRAVPRTVLFVAPIPVPQDALLRTLGCDVGENGFIAADFDGATSVPGVFAAGDVVRPYGQLVDAVAAGNRAGAALNHYLVRLDIAAARASYEAEQPFSAALESLAQRVRQTTVERGI